MKKIIWISSYPKSGNTWLRFVLSNYFYNIAQNETDLTILDKIDKFPPHKFLKKIVNENNLKKNPYDICKYWLEVQKQIINETSDPFVFLKNHNALVKIDNYELTNPIFSLAAIYIVRDPRDVLVSYLNFDKTLNKKKAIDRLIHKDLYCHVSKKNFLDIEVLGSWKFNYISWRDGVKDIPRIMVKYEDLIENTYKTFEKIVLFLSEILDKKINTKRLEFSINQASFKRLQNLENKFGFIESSNKFFNLGKSNNWENILERKEKILIENSFKNEMKELNYL